MVKTIVIKLNVDDDVAPCQVNYFLTNHGGEFKEETGGELYEIESWEEKTDE